MKIINGSNEKAILLELVIPWIIIIRLEIDLTFDCGFNFGVHLAFNNKQSRDGVIYNGIHISCINAGLSFFRLKEQK